MSAPLFDLIHRASELCLCGHYSARHDSGTGHCHETLDTLTQTIKPCTCIKFHLELPSPNHVAASDQSRLFRARANDWIESNEPAWNKMKSMAFSSVQVGNRFGIGEIAEQVRWFYKTNEVAGEAFKLSNSLRAYFIRRMICEHPQIYPFVKLKPVRH